MTNPTLERAARAAYEAWIDDVRDLEPAWDDLPESHRERLVQSARAVLMAVREPDEAMKLASFEASGDALAEAWPAIIDAILNGEGE